MRTRQLGTTGTFIPEIGIGTWLYRGGPDLLRVGIDHGAAFVDTAEYYGNEEIVGRALRGIRDRVFVATKTHHWRHREVMACAEASLRKLGVDVIDLYQLHWPNSAVPLAETMSAFEDLVDQGKVRFIGVSNFTLPELQAAERAMRKHRIVANQLRYSLVHRSIEPRLLPYCQQRGMAVIAYSPLGHRFGSLVEADRGGAFPRVTRETGRTVAQIALNWCLAKPGVVAIPKTESADHMVENCGASGWDLSAEQIDLLNRSVRYRSRGRLEQWARRTVRGVLQHYRIWREPGGVGAPGGG